VISSYFITDGKEKSNITKLGVHCSLLMLTFNIAVGSYCSCMVMNNSSPFGFILLLSSPALVAVLAFDVLNLFGKDTNLLNCFDSRIIFLAHVDGGRFSFWGGQLPVHPST
jgi:hypothetical protein